MYQYDDVTVVASLPVPAALGTVGYFTDGSSGGGIPPTRLRSDFMNMLMMEMLNVVTAAGLTPSKNTYTQVLTAIQLMIQQETGNYALDTGSANTYLVAFNPAVTVLTNGMVLRFKALNANSGASTVAVNAIAAKSIVRDDGAGSALQAGDIPANGIIEMVYDLPNTRFVLTSVNQNLATIAIQQQLGNYVTAGGTANAITGTLNPALTGHVAGLPIRVKLTASNTGATTFNPNGVGAVAIQNPLGGALISGDLQNGQIAYLMYDGTVYRLLNYRAQIATQAEVVANADLVKIVPAGRLQFHDGVCKGFVSWDNNGSSGTTAKTYNVSGVTDTGIARTTINLATALDGAAYATSANAGDLSGSNTGWNMNHVFNSAGKVAGSLDIEGNAGNFGASAIADLNDNNVQFWGRFP